MLMDVPLLTTEFASLKALKKPIHLAIGVFDGVHLGHLAVIEPAVSSARSMGGISAVLTFNPHPSRLFKGSGGTDLIMGIEDKSAFLHRLGVDCVIAKSFDPDFASIPAESFLGYLSEVLPELKAVYVGENFRFGTGRKGDIQTLIQSGSPLGIDVWSIDRIKQNGQPISSTRIREALRAGQMEHVNALLGYTYFAEGEIVKGAQLGSKLGFPTMNVQWAPECRPLYGVYVVRFCLIGSATNICTEDSQPWKQGVANFGLRPTVNPLADIDQSSPLLEVHALEVFSADLGDRIRVECLHFIREEQGFESTEALQKQIVLDCECAKKFFSRE